MQTIITRLGHCFFSHGHLILREEPPWCGTCYTRVTVDHILIDCPRYGAERIDSKIENSTRGTERCMVPFCYVNYKDFFY